MSMQLQPSSGRRGGSNNLKPLLKTAGELTLVNKNQVTAGNIYSSFCGALLTNENLPLYTSAKHRAMFISSYMGHRGFPAVR